MNMKQQHIIGFACVLFIILIAVCFAQSGQLREQIRTLTRTIEDMTVKLDEMDVKLESMEATSRIANSAIKEAEQRIKTLENVHELSGTNLADSKEVVKLVWILYSEPPKLQGWSEVEEALNEYSAEKIGVTCDFIYMGKDELGGAILDAHDYDIAFTCDWWNDFAHNVSAGNFRDLTDDLKSYPNLRETVLDSTWAGTKVNGGIYAIPHMKDIGCEVFWILNSNYFLKEKGFDKNQYISFEEIGPYLKTYKIDHPDDYPIKIASTGITSWQSGLVDWLNMDTLIGLDWNARGTDQELVVKSALEIPAWQERLRTIHRWYELGYINPDAPELSSMPRAQSGVVQSGQGWFGAETIWANSIKQPVYIARFDGPYLSTSSIQAMTAVSAFSEHPAEALKLIELMNTDPWYRETARYGIEGKHYIRNYDGTIIRTDEGNENVGVQAYAQGHLTLGALEASLFPEVPTDTHQWEKTMAGYAAATVSAAMGFTPDLSSVSAECEELKKVVAEFSPQLYTGASDPNTVIPQMLKRMEAAGLRKVMAEIQRQLNEFIADK